jgi:hypothetical protein
MPHPDTDHLGLIAGVLCDYSTEQLETLARFSRRMQDQDPRPVSDTSQAAIHARLRSALGDMLIDLSVAERDRRAQAWSAIVDAAVLGPRHVADVEPPGRD